jgi:hypothetical protein
MPDLDDPMIAALLVAGVVLAAVIVIALIRRSGRRRLDNLAPAFELGTTRLVGPFGNMIEGLYQGYTCRYTLEQRSQYSPGGATLRVSAASPHQWSASVADMGSRLMVSIGILKDFDIGDPELDQRIRFSGTDEASILTVFSTTATRSAIRALSESENFASVTVRADRVDVKWAPRKPELDDYPDPLRTRLQAVIDLLTACGYPPQMG